MYRKLFFLFLVAAFGLTSSVQAYTIIWVSCNKSYGVLVAGEAADQGFVDLLRAQGYTVDYRGEEGSGDPDFRYWRSLDAGKIAELEAADLIIVSRDTDSGAYDDNDGAEAAQWNGITTPLILMASHIRGGSAKWGWTSSGDDDATSADLYAEMPEHYIFTGVNLVDNEVSIVINSTSVGDGTMNVNNNYTLIARRNDSDDGGDGVWIAEWEAGTQFYTGFEAVAGGHRMYFASGSNATEDGDYNLTADGQTLWLNAVDYMITGGYNPKAREPNPADGAEDVSVETILTWTRGDGADWDRVYFGTDPCDVNLPQVKLIEVLPMNPAEYDPGDPNLRASTTYYWYITEINSPIETNSLPVWSFTTVSGKAQCESPVDGAVIAGDPYIPNPAYTYTEMTFIMGPTAVKHTGYFSANRDDVLNRVEDANIGPPPLAGLGFGERYERLYYAGRPEYGNGESLIRGEVYYWTVDEEDPFGNLYPGEIWSFAVQPYEAFVPSPPNEAIYIDPNVVLSWLAGYGAQGHDIFIGTSWEDVNNAIFTFLPPGPSPEYAGSTVGADTFWQFDGLPTNTKFYWRIDGFQGRLPPNLGLVQKGRVWEFTTRGPMAGLTGEYYHHTGGGSPAGFESKVLVRIDPNINFDFGADPAPGVNPDNFSVRWTGLIAAQHKGETYTFTTVTDDGVRLWVNDQLIIDQWINQSPTPHSGDIKLDDYGPYNIRMEYYENGGGAVARLNWESPSTAYGIVPDNFLSPNTEALTPYGLYPRDDSLVTDWQPILHWGPALFAATHNLYFSSDFDDVNERLVTPIPLTDPCYHSPRLELDQIYYWAVDGVNTLHGSSPWEGDVWSFTIPHGGVGSILREWWSGISGTAVSALTGDSRYPDYPNGQELIDAFDGPLNWADNYGSRIHGWLRPPTTGDYTFWIASDNHSELWLSSDAEPGNVGTDPIAQQTNSPWDRYNWDADPERESNSISLEAGKKYYIAALMKEGTGGDHVAVAWQGPADSPIPDRVVIQGDYLSPTPHDPPEAYGPYPADGATGVEDRTPILSWYPGFYEEEQSTEHKLYFSPSRDDVNDRLVTPITRTEPNYPIPYSLLLDRTYYWAVDEQYSTPPYEFKGRVWKFTTATCMYVDNMEDYNDRGEIRRVWTDGYASVGWGAGPDYEPQNTASSGSNLNASTEVGSPFGASGPIHGGDQAMVLRYDNDGHTYPGLPGEEDWDYDAATFSEIEANTAADNLDVGGDWSGQGVKLLTMWFQGHPISDGNSFFDNWPEFSVAGRGRDIEGGHDEFHFLAMYPWVIPGDTHWIQVRVVDMNNTDGSAKAGLMIREDLTPYSRYAAVFVTPENGITFQWRDTVGGPTGNVTETSRSAPQYLMLERTASGAFTASYSDTGDSWDWADVNVSENPDVTSHTVPMGDPCQLYAGAAVTSHNAAQLCVADFNNWDAYPWPPTQPWIHSDIGLNAPEQLYVALQDASDNIAVVEHNNVNAATLTTWEEWDIPLSAFTPTVDLTNIKKVRIGLGNRDVPELGGSGVLYIDDIIACPPKCIARYGKPDYDIAEPYDCIVDEKDIMVLAGDWLLRDDLIDTVAPDDANLVAYWPLDNDFDDYSGNNFHGDPNAGAALVSDVNRGKVLRLYSDGDFVDCGNPTDPCALDFGTGNWTVCAWVKTTMSGDTEGDKGVIYGKGGDLGGGHRYGLYVNEDQGTQGRITLVTDDDVNKRTVNSSIIVSDGKWHHVAGLRDVNDLRVYVDGLLDGSISTLPTGYDLSGTHQHNAYIGAITDHAADANGTVIYKFLQGSVDDVRIYDYALSPEEVAYLAVDGEAGLHIPIASPADVYKGEAPGSQWINLRDYSLIASKYLEEKLWPFE